MAKVDSTKQIYKAYLRRRDRLRDGAVHDQATSGLLGRACGFFGVIYRQEYVRKDVRCYVVLINHALRYEVLLPEATDRLVCQSENEDRRRLVNTG